MSHLRNTGTFMMARGINILLFLAMVLLTVCPANGLQYHGADLSSLLLVEANGVKFKDTNGNQGAMEDILRNNGLNTARVRLWTSGTYNTTYGLAMGKVRYSPSPLLHL